MRALIAATLLAFAASAAIAAPPEDLEPALRYVEKLRESGQIEEASAEAEKLLATHPEALDVHIVWQDAQIAAGKSKAVVAKYKELAALPDATADIHYLAGRVQRGLPAIGEFRAALKIDPKHFWAECGLAVELTRSKGYAEARTLLEDAAKLRPNSAIPVNAMGRVEEARGKYAEAEKLYRAALELDQGLTVARVNLGMTLLALGKKEDAIATLQDAAKRAPKDAMALVGIGMYHRANKDERSAAENFKKAIDANGSDVSALSLLASTYLGLDQPDMAEDPLQRALKIAPDDVDLNVLLAYLRLQQQKYDEAARVASAAVLTDDSSAEAHYILGLVYDHQVQPKKADAEFRRAERLDEDNPLYVRACAAIAQSMGDWTRAIAEYAKAAKMMDNDPDALMELAFAYLGAQKPKAAASTYDQIVSATPTKLEAWLQLGIVCGRDLKDKPRSLRAFHEYVNRGGKDPRVPGWIAQLEAKDK